MEEDFFLKNMKGVKPFKKDTSIIENKKTNKKNVKLDKKTDTKNTHKQTITEQKVSNSKFKLWATNFVFSYCFFAGIFSISFFI